MAVALSMGSVGLPVLTGYDSMERASADPAPSCAVVALIALRSGTPTLTIHTIEEVRMQSTLKRRLRLVALAVFTAALPLAFSPSQGVRVNNACAASRLDGSCCPKNAICGLNGQNYVGYDLNSGSCPQT